MSNSCAKIIIRKVYESDFTWTDLENYFSVNQEVLLDDLKKYLKTQPYCEEKLKTILEQIESNAKLSEDMKKFELEQNKEDVLK